MRKPFDRREAALSGVPHVNPPVRTEEKEEKLYVTVLYERPTWQCVLGADATAERTFGLDEYGRLVYEFCNGERSVKTIIRMFSRETNVSRPEAERSVTEFMRTLMSKGLIGMEMDLPGS
ncbi:MAG: PqqD family protein [Phycisphaeraceae bacterium]|nr:PqqD family protein [Phycisphaeraceae bacterium]